MFTAGPPVSKTSLQLCIYLLVRGQNSVLCSVRYVSSSHFLLLPVNLTVAPPYIMTLALNGGTPF